MNHCSDFNLIELVLFREKDSRYQGSRENVSRKRGDNILGTVGSEISNYCLQNSELLIEDMVWRKHDQPVFLLGK